MAFEFPVAAWQSFCELLYSYFTLLFLRKEVTKWLSCQMSWRSSDIGPMVPKRLCSHRWPFWPFPVIRRYRRLQQIIDRRSPITSYSRLVMTTTPCCWILEILTTYFWPQGRFGRETRATLCVGWTVVLVWYDRLTQTKRVSFWWALSATVSFCSATCIVCTRVSSMIMTVQRYTDKFYTRRCSRLNCRESSRRGSVSRRLHNTELSRRCYKLTSTTTNVVDDSAYSSASAQPWTRTTVADGQRFSAVRRLSRRLLDRSKNAFFAYATCTCIWSFRWGDRIGILSRPFAS